MVIKVSNLRKLIQYLMEKLWVAYLLCRKIPWTRSSLKSLARRSRYSEICQRGKWGRIARIQKEILLTNIYLSSFGPTCRYLQILASYQTFKFWGCSADGTRRRERVLTPLRHLRHLGQIGGAWYGSNGIRGKSNSAPPYIFCSNRQACIRFFRPNVRMQILLTFPFYFDGVQLLSASASPNLLCICFYPRKKRSFSIQWARNDFSLLWLNEWKRRRKGGKFTFLTWNNIASPQG